MGTIDIALERVFTQLVRGNAGLAIMELETYLAAWPNPQSKEKLDTLKTEYQLMTDYWAQGVKDPKLEEQYLLLLQRAYLLCANISIYKHISSSSFLHGIYNMVRQRGHSWSLESVRREMEGFVSDAAMLDLEPEQEREAKGRQLFRQHRDQMNALFNYVLTSRMWTDGVASGMEDILLSPTVESIDQQLLISAITLSLMNRFDMAKFRLLVNVYRQSDDEHVRQRALVGWVMGIDDDFLSVYPEQLQLVRQLTKSKRVCRELTELQIQLVYTLSAEKDRSTIEKDIMPDLLKNNTFRITRNGIEEVEDNELEDVLNPNAAEERMEKLEDRMRQMMDMQKRGSDIFFGGFSQMKRFPFFYDVSNWFVPFYLEHPDIAQFVQNMTSNRFLEYLLHHAPFSDSDKYSFVMAYHEVVKKLPDALRRVLDQGEVAFDGIPTEDQVTPAYIRRMYLMDLYRFFRLFPNRSALCNPFDTAKAELGMCLFFGSQLFSGTPLEGYKGEIVAMLLKHQRKQAANTLLATFPEQLQDVQYFLWTENYAGALALDADNERALVGHARQAFNRGDYEEAEADYDRLHLLHPDSMKYLLNKAICLVRKKEYGDALQLLYQLSYEYPDNISVLRVLAWTLTCDGKQEQADKVYEQVVRSPNVKDDDYLNRGYCLWLQNRIGEAAASFRKYLSMQQNHTDDFFFWESDLLSENGITATDIKMMQALISA